MLTSQSVCQFLRNSERGPSSDSRQYMKLGIPLEVPMETLLREPLSPPQAWKEKKEPLSTRKEDPGGLVGAEVGDLTVSLAEDGLW